MFFSFQKSVYIFFAEYGYWNLTIRSAQSLSDSIGDFCDVWSLCDTYVKIRVDGRVVWRSKTHWNEPLPKFFETYHSPRMKKDSKIVVEMWDDDNELVPSDDDFMDRWHTRSASAISHRKQLIGRKWEAFKYRNRLFIDSHWQDEWNRYDLTKNRFFFLFLFISSIFISVCVSAFVSVLALVSSAAVFVYLHFSNCVCVCVYFAFFRSRLKVNSPIITIKILTKRIYI